MRPPKWRCRGNTASCLTCWEWQRAVMFLQILSSFMYELKIDHSLRLPCYFVVKTLFLHKSQYCNSGQTPNSTAKKRKLHFETFVQITLFKFNWAIFYKHAYWCSMYLNICDSLEMSQLERSVKCLLRMENNGICTSAYSIAYSHNIWQCSTFPQKDLGHNCHEPIRK